MYTWGLQRKLNAVTLKLFGGYTQTSRLDDMDSSLVSVNPDAYNGSVQHGKYTGKYLSNEAQLNYHRQHFSFVGGAGLTSEHMGTHIYTYYRPYNYTSVTDYDSLGIKANTGFVYGRGAYAIPAGSNMLNIGAGLRYSHHNRFGDFLTFEINPSFKAGNNTLLYANISGGFNAPSLYQLYAPEKNYSSGITRGNGLLKPEKSFTYEAGIKSIVDKVFIINLSVYTSVVNNYIDYVYLWDKNKPVNALSYTDYLGDTYLNTGKMTNSGFELATTVILSPKFDISANLSINAGKLEYDPAAINTAKTGGNRVQLFSSGSFLTQNIREKDLVRRPGSMANISLAYKPLTVLKLMLDVRCTGSRPDVYYDPALGPFGALGRNNVASFTLTNLSAFYDVTKALKANLQINNIFNTQYLEINGFTTRGRGIQAGLNFNF
jgi:vitamin B12 transporter